MNAICKQLFTVLFTASFFYSCEETIDPNLEDAAPLLVVDAWINNKAEDQRIILMWSQPYLENQLPEGVSGATVSVSYDGGQIIFEEDTNEPGTYLWTTSPGDADIVFGQIGREYKLTVLINGETFEATSRLNRTVAIDSITFKFEESSPFYPDNSYTAEFWAVDPLGNGDTYWIKTYKNGTLLNKPSELNIAYDGGAGAGANFDGVTFLPPIRSINPVEEDEHDELLSPYQPGDSVYVEIHSITLEAYNFLEEVIVQTDRPGGFGELFSNPLSNVSTNITNINPEGNKALGFFNVSAVSGLGRRFEE